MINKKLVIVGPGYLPIPITGKSGWGGIENTLSSITDELSKRQVNYILINDKDNYLDQLAVEVDKGDCIVHCHYDLYCESIRAKFGNNVYLIATSHSPYHSYKELWNSHVERDYERLFGSIDAYFGQSNEANAIAREIKPNLQTGICRCCVSEEPFIKNRVEVGNGRVLMLGKIEPRKNQTMMRNEFSELPIDFVGSISDTKFNVDEVWRNTRYLGSWSRDEVYYNLPKYSVLMCVSSFEGDVGVVKEALAAGCSVVLSPLSSLNMHREWSFVTVLPNTTSKTDIVASVNKAIATNSFHKNEIYRVFDSIFSRKVVVDQYLSGLTNLRL